MGQLLQPQRVSNDLICKISCFASFLLRNCQFIDNQRVFKNSIRPEWLTKTGQDGPKRYKKKGCLVAFKSVKVTFRNILIIMNISSSKIRSLHMYELKEFIHVVSNVFIPILGCFRQSVVGRRLATKYISKSWTAYSLEECKQFCLGESSFQCQGFAYRLTHFLKILIIQIMLIIGF